MTDRIFLLSPANCSGLRARLVFNPRAQFAVAERLRSPGGAPLGEVFSFLSGLYFRGKLTYARAFARPPLGMPGVLIITAGSGLLAADEPVSLRQLERFARVPIDAAEHRYRRPLARASRSLAERAEGCEVVLLGSIASGKYVDILGKIFGERLLFPSDFVGRGDMSRGGLLLRHAAADIELSYVPVAGAVRHGPRPPKLAAPCPPSRR